MASIPGVSYTVGRFQISDKQSTTGTVIHRKLDRLTLIIYVYTLSIYLVVCIYVLFFLWINIQTCIHTDQ